MRGSLNTSWTKNLAFKIAFQTEKIRTEEANRSKDFIYKVSYNFLNCKDKVKLLPDKPNISHDIPDISD